MDMLISNKYSFNDLLCITEGFEMLIGFNILESIHYLIDIQNLNNKLPIVYENCIYADVFETFMVKNQDISIKAYIYLLYVMNIKYINKKPTDIYYYNKYISKSAIIAQDNYSDKDLRKILIEMYEAYEKNDISTLNKYKKYKKSFNDNYNIEI